MALMAIEFRAAERPPRSSVTKPGPKWLSRGLLACGFGMVPWLFVLAATLPGSTGVPHWSMAWVGLDAMEAAGLVTTGWLLRREDPRRGLTAMATSALLVTDAWFDITTSASGASLIEAIAMAVFAEIPMAVLCGAIAYRAMCPSRSLADLEPDAGAGRLAQEAPAVGDLVDQLEAAPAFVLAPGLAPVRDPGAAVVGHVDVHDLAAAGDGDGDRGGVGGVLHRVRDQLAGEQFGIHRARVVVQAVADEPSCGGDLVGSRVERTSFRSAGCGVRWGSSSVRPCPLRVDDRDGRSGHIRPPHRA